MDLLLQHLIPAPLKNKITDNSSDVWKQQLNFKKSERIFIQAPSGTGKTTLVHILYDIRKDYEGEVYWDDKLWSTMNNTQTAHLRATSLSIIFQDLRLFPEMTAWENLEIKRTLTNTVTEDRAEEMMQRLGIYEKKQALAKTLSYGEQQRVAIIRALLQPFEWLLMDEPFSHLDHLNIEKAVSLIDEVIAINNAGLVIADLEKNNYFTYHQRLFL